MNPNLKVHAALKINGHVIQLGEGMIELKLVPIHLARTIMESDLTHQSFSTIELRVSKRPIQWDEKQPLDTGLLDHIRQVANDDPIEGFPDITYGELAALDDDPTWTQYRAFKLNPEQFQGADAQDIVWAWNKKYDGTKFARLMQ